MFNVLSTPRLEEDLTNLATRVANLCKFRLRTKKSLFLNISHVTTVTTTTTQQAPPMPHPRTSGSRDNQELRTHHGPQGHARPPAIWQGGGSWERFFEGGKKFTLACSLRVQVLCSRKFTKCPTGTFWLKLVGIAHWIPPELLEEKLPSISVFEEHDAMAHPMEAEYVMIESVRDAQPDVEDLATVSSPGMESLDQAADAASTALRHAEAEGARGLAVFGQPVLVSELDAQEQIRELERHLQELKSWG